MSAKDGGPAFPVAEEFMAGGKGMSLRDYFAGQALVGLCASDTEDSFIPNEKKGRMAYQLADEMLKARESIK